MSISSMFFVEAGDKAALKFSDFDVALEMYDRAIKKDKNDAKAYSRKCGVLIEAGDYQVALITVNVALEDNLENDEELNELKQQIIDLLEGIDSNNESIGINDNYKEDKQNKKFENALNDLQELIVDDVVDDNKQNDYSNNLIEAIKGEKKCVKNIEYWWSEFWPATVIILVFGLYFLTGGMILLVFIPVGLIIFVYYLYFTPEDRENRKEMKEQKREEWLMQIKKREENEDLRKQQIKEDEMNVYGKLRSEIECMPEYRKWRENVLKNNDYNCVICGSTENIEVDHRYCSFYSLIKKYDITNITEAYECGPLWDVENGALLCRNCHKKTKSSVYYHKQRSLEVNNVNEYEKIKNEKTEDINSGVIIQGKIDDLEYNNESKNKEFELNQKERVISESDDLNNNCLPEAFDVILDMIYDIDLKYERRIHICLLKFRILMVDRFFQEAIFMLDELIILNPENDKLNDIKQRLIEEIEKEENNMLLRDLRTEEGFNYNDYYDNLNKGVNDLLDNPDDFESNKEEREALERELEEEDRNDYDTE